MAKPRQPNSALASVIAETGWSYASVALAVVTVASENGSKDFVATGRSHVAYWLSGTRPSGLGPEFLSEALSRRLGRVVSLNEIGLAGDGEPSAGGIGWGADTLTALTDLGRIDASMERRHVLGSAAYAVAALAMPDRQWWTAMAERGTTRTAPGARLVGRADVGAVRQMTALFSEMDQRHGGGHGRTTVAHYLAVDVSGFLRGRYTNDRDRKDMFSAASELAYVCGWMAFDNAEHGTAQRWFTEAVKLAAEADDPPMAAHVLRAMAHQAIDLHHFDKGLEFAAGSIDGDGYRLAAPRERALLGVVYAKALANTGNTRASAAALIRAEDDLAAAGPGDDEPSRVFFFGEASLAHETACTLRDSGDVDGAIREFRRSVRTRKASAFTRTHAVTLGYLGSLHAGAGNVEEACGIWGRALDAMEDGVHSGRTRKVAEDMRSALTPFRRRGIKAAVETDTRAMSYLKAVA